MTITESSPFRVIGTRPIRHDGLDKVTGRARFANDINVPGHLTAKLLRSPHAHARILSIDTSRAQALPGVRAIVTGADMPELSAILREQTEGSLVNLGLLSRGLLARDKASYRGHPVAAVAAINASVAAEALALIDVQYEILAPVLSAIEAMKPGAPIVIEELRTNVNSTFRGGGLRAPDEEASHSNVATTFTMEIGDLANGFELADIILERDYHTSAAHQGYIEPQSATAFWSSDELLTIWTTTQGPFAIRDQTALILKLPAGQIKVIPSEIGGGFGAKLNVSIEPVVARLSQKCGEPVKLTLDRRRAGSPHDCYDRQHTLDIERFRGAKPRSGRSRSSFGGCCGGQVTHELVASAGFRENPGHGLVGGAADYRKGNVCASLHLGCWLWRPLRRWRDQRKLANVGSCSSVMTTVATTRSR